jgi:hypothetical protein
MAEEEGIKRGLVCIFSLLEPCRTFFFKFEKAARLSSLPEGSACLFIFLLHDREFGLICPGRGAGRGSADIGH